MAFKYYEKVLCEQACEEVNNVLETQIDEIREHYYRKDIQNATYRAQVKELKGEMVIHVDYSVNFKNKQ